MDLNLIALLFVVGGMLLAIFSLVKQQAPLVSVAVLLVCIAMLITRFASKGG